MNIETKIIPTFADVEAAAKKLAGVAVRTPLLNFPILDDRLGARVFLKAETMQRMGAFKFRGAYNKISSIPADKRAAGVVAFSSGNHAQGVAAAAKLLGVPAVIVMPSDAPMLKRERTASLGAEVVLYDRDTEDREAIARAIAEKKGAMLVPPYDDPLIIAGQGTLGREIVEDLAQAQSQAGNGRGRRVRRRARGRHRARHQGGGARRRYLDRGAGRLRRHVAFVQERQARIQCTHERHDLRCADDAYSGRDHLRDQFQIDRQGRDRQRRGNRRARWCSPSRN